MAASKSDGHDSELFESELLRHESELLPHESVLSPHESSVLLLYESELLPSGRDAMGSDSLHHTDSLHHIPSSLPVEEKDVARGGKCPREGARAAKGERADDCFSPVPNSKLT